MADRSHRFGLDQQRIIVAINQHLLYLQKVARRFALGPKPLLGTAEECNYAFGLRFVQRFLIHITQHQHFTGQVILNYCGYQAIVLVKIDFHGKVKMGKSAKKVFLLHPHHHVLFF
jgi:hypothetical protein